MKGQSQEEEEMSIGELARRANVSVRTIRFYIAEGLLSTPQARGRFATYGEDALLRLMVIRRLKEEYLPLREIRERLANLSSAEVRNLSVELAQQSRPARRSHTTAVEYIDRITAGNEVHRLTLEDAPEKKAAPRFLPGAPQPRRSPAAERWRHYRLASGVVLLAREPLDNADEKRLEELLRIAETLFSNQGVKNV